MEVTGEPSEDPVALRLQVEELKSFARQFKRSAIPPTPTTVSRTFREGFSNILDGAGAENFSERIEHAPAIISVKFSSKSELSSRFFGRLKFRPENRLYGGGNHVKSPFSARRGGRIIGGR